MIGSNTNQKDTTSSTINTSTGTWDVANLTWWINTGNVSNLTWWWIWTWTVFSWNNSWTATVSNNSLRMEWNWFDRLLNRIIPYSDSKWNTIQITPIGSDASAVDVANKWNQNSFSIPEFSLDPYVENSWEWENLLDMSVESKERVSAIEDDFWTKEEFAKNLWLAVFNVAKNRVLEWESKDVWLSDAYGVITNTLERQFPNTIWAYRVNKTVEKKYWWSWFSDKEWKVSDSQPLYTYKYMWPNEIWFNLAANSELPAWEQAYNDWYISREQYDEFTDNIYNTFADDIDVMIDSSYWHSSMKAQAPKWTKISKDAFMRYMKNINNKAIYTAEENEKRWIPNEEDTSSFNIKNWVQYWLKIIWEKVETSPIKTVADREEFMNDAYAALYDQISRLYSRMYWTFSVKAQLQYELWVDDLWDLSYDEVPDEWKETYNKIYETEQNFTKFITNYAEYISYLPSYVDPETWKLDRIPDVVSDWTNTYTYTEKMFDWVTLDNFGFGTFHNASPIDILQLSSMNIRKDWSDKTWGRIDKAWIWSQYYMWEAIWWTVNEVSQQVLWWLWVWISNMFSQDSWDIPFEFVDMDSSILATLTTNDTNRWRLLQSYAVKWAEYWPEIIWNIIYTVAADKGASKLWQAWQLRILTQLNKYPFFRNTVKWRQIAQWLAYSSRFLQRLWTDQLLIDAPLSIGDTEWWSDFSKWLSLYWTMFWEWIWILYDLKALNKSIWYNFRRNNQYAALTDPIRLMADNPGILDDVAKHLWRTSVDASWKIVWDSYKLLVQDLSSYSKYLNSLSNDITNVVESILKEWWNINPANQAIKQWAYNVLKQVFKQNSAMSKIVTDMITDNRANIADIIKYIWGIDWTVKIWPFISTIKIDNWWQLAQRVVTKYNPGMDLVVDWWLVEWINRWLTRAEVDELVRQWYIKASDISSQWFDAMTLEKYFSPYKMEDWTIRYYPTKEWLELLWVDVSSINNPLAIATMSEDTKQLIDKLKSLPENKRLSDAMLDAIWETDAINKLAENIANIKHLDICK